MCSEEYEYLFKLYSQGITNGVPIELISREEALEIEPSAKIYGDKVIWSPTTSVASPAEVIEAMRDYVTGHFRNVTIHYDCAYRRILRQGATTTTLLGGKDNFEAKYVINSGGLHSHKISREFGFGHDYYALPLKGNYLISESHNPPFRTLVYPVPIKGAFFLGVHSTITADNKVKLGPSLQPAFSSENYRYLEGLNPIETFDILKVYTRMLFSKQRGLLMRLALHEFPKMSRWYMLRSALTFHDFDTALFRKWYKPGIRAQLIRKSSLEIVNDFVLEGDERSFHVLNAISPGWTSSFPFSDHVVGRVKEFIDR